MSPLEWRDSLKMRKTRTSRTTRSTASDMARLPGARPSSAIAVPSEKKYGAMATTSTRFMALRKNRTWSGDAANRTRSSTVNQTMQTVSMTKNGSANSGTLSLSLLKLSSSLSSSSEYL